MMVSMSAMHITFPNPYGARPASQAQIASLQQRIGFSDAYADFLRMQNGFSMLRMETAANRDRFLTASDQILSEQHANFRDLHSFVPDQDIDDVARLHGQQVFARWFLEIGFDPAGNPFVEVLHGQHRGKIGSLDHDLFAGADSESAFLSDIELPHIATWSWADQADALCAADLGLVWMHARSMQSFVQQLHCDAQFWGFVVDEAGL